MRINQLKEKRKAPFFKDDKLTIRVNIDKTNKITSFEVTLQGKEKKFDVKNFDILSAWQQVENHLKSIK